MILNLQDTQDALYHGNREESECEATERAGVISLTHRKEFGKVKLGQKKAFSFLQNVSWLATQLSLEIINSYSLLHCQKPSQHACITHQVFKLQLSSSEGNLEIPKLLLIILRYYNKIIYAENLTFFKCVVQCCTHLKKCILSQLSNFF